MRRLLWISLIFISMLIGELSFKIKFSEVFAQQVKAVPKHIKELVFEKSKFSQPITLQLPCEDDPEYKRKILGFSGGLEPLHVRREYDMDRIVLFLLTSKGFAKLEKFAKIGIIEYDFLSYSNSIKPYIINRETYEYSKCKGSFYILLANRTLKSIDYTNQYEASPKGVKIKYYALTFTYILKEKFPGLPSISRQYEGKAKAYLDPDDGKWKVENLSLSDSGIWEYRGILEKQYKEYEKELEAKRKKEEEQAEAERIKRASQKYKDNNDGTVTDVTTGLVWTRGPVGYGYGWTKAKSACGNLVIGSLRNWRLPSRPELQTIIDKEKETIIDTPDRKYFAKVVTDDKTILTSTEDAISEYIWMWSLQEKSWRKVNKESAEDGYYLKFLCVHSTEQAIQQNQILSSAGVPSPKPSTETPEKITIAWLTKDMPDAGYFQVREETFNVNFDDAWDAVNTYFKKERFTINNSDRERGVLITNEKIGQVLFPYKEKFVVLIEKVSDASTKITVKGMAWNKMKGQWEVIKFRGGVGVTENFLKEISKELKAKIKQSSSSDSQPKNADSQKLKTYITDQWKQVIQMPPPKRDWRELVTLKVTGKYDDYSSLYLLGVNMRGRASDAFASADKFLKKGDLTNAQKYANIGAKHYIESNNLFNASEQVFSGSVSMAAKALEAMYRGSAEASKYGWALMCGPKCYEVADYVFLMTDFAVDYSTEGMDEAKKNMVTKVFIKTLLKMDGISSWIESRTTHLIGDSGLYGLMDKTINSPEFQKAFMKVVAESGAYANKKMAEEGVKMFVQNSLDFIKGSSNIKPM